MNRRHFLSLLASLTFVQKVIPKAADPYVVELYGQRYFGFNAVAPKVDAGSIPIVYGELSDEGWSRTTIRTRIAGHPILDVGSVYCEGGKVERVTVFPKTAEVEYVLLSEWYDGDWHPSPIAAASRDLP